MSCKFHFISIYFYCFLFRRRLRHRLRHRLRRSESDLWLQELWRDLVSVVVFGSLSVPHLAGTFPDCQSQWCLRAFGSWSVCMCVCVCCLCQMCNKLVFWFSALPAKLAPSLHPLLSLTLSSWEFFILAKSFIVCRVFKLHFLFIDRATKFASFQRGKEWLCEGIRRRLLKILAAVNTWDYDFGFVSSRLAVLCLIWGTFQMVWECGNS